jgi:hypothetical protein
MGVDRGDVRVFKDEMIQMREKIERLEMVNRDHDLDFLRSRKTKEYQLRS